MRKTAIFLVGLGLFLTSGLYADYEAGKAVFEKKCTECHEMYVPPKKVMENYFQKDNKLLNLKAPSANMIVFALFEGSKKVGDPSDPDMQKMEVEAFLSSYLYNPNLEHSICDPEVLKFYETMESQKGKVSEEEIGELTDFFMQYKTKRAKQ